MTTQNKIKISIIIFLSLSISLIIFIIHPLFQEIKKNSEGLFSEKEKLITAQAKIENLEEFKTLYRDLLPDLEKIDALFVNPDFPVEFISFLEETAKISQASIKISPPLPSKIAGDPWPSLIFQINSISSFPNFLRFLEKLESGPYLVEIQNLTTKRLAETELQAKKLEKLPLGDVNVTLSIKVFTY